MLETLDLTANQNLEFITSNIKELKNLRTIIVAFTPYNYKKRRELERLLPDIEIILVE